MAFPMTAQTLATLLGGQLQGSPSLLLTHIATLEEATGESLSFYHNKNYKKQFLASRAGCILVSEKDAAIYKGKSVLLVVDNPYDAFRRAVEEYVASSEKIEYGFRHPTALIHPTATVSPTAYIGAYCVIEAHCKVGERAVLHPHTILRKNSKVGCDTLLHPRVTCYPDTVIGERCIIHSGVVLGSDGFGYTENKDASFSKIPQIGNVILGNEVEIGANTTIDRAALGSTSIGDGVKLDNIIQIAHNVQIGENTAIAAQAGISGSANIGKRNRIGGQVGMVGHISTADDVVVLAQSGVAKSIPTQGMYFGSPAKERLLAAREIAALHQLPDLIREVAALKKQIETLQNTQTVAPDNIN